MSDKLNEERRKRYLEDSKYRKTKQDEARNRYRKEVSAVPNENNVAKKNVGQERKNAELKMVDGRNLLVVHVKHVAKMTGRRVDTFNLWITRGMVPSPPYDGYYTLAQTRIIVRVLAKHFNGMKYFREDHSETIIKLKQSFYNAS